MKKFFSFLFVFLIVFLTNCIDVYALDNNPLDLISVTEDSSVVTEHFYYSEISYSAVEKEFKIKNLKNKTNENVYMGIDILLFDMEKKNIGFISYCTKKDLDGKYAQQKVNANAISPLTVEVKDKYFVGGKSAYDVYYYAILDDNYSCRSYGSNKYEGLMIEEIRDGKISSNYNEDTLWLSDFFKELSFGSFLGFFLILIVVHLVISFITSLLFKRVYTKNIFLSFIPILNMVVAIKLAFGYVIAFLSSVFLAFSIYNIFVKGSVVLIIIFCVFLLISLGICIYKCITEKYRLFFIEDMVINLIKNLKKKEEDNSNDSGNQLLDLSFSDKKDNDKLELNNDDFDFDSNFSSIDVNDLNNASLNSDNNISNLDNTDVNSSVDQSSSSDVLDSLLNNNDSSSNDNNDDDPWSFK